MALQTGLQDTERKLTDSIQSISDTMNDGLFTWRFTDKTYLTQRSQNKFCILSKAFTIGGYKWKVIYIY